MIDRFVQKYVVDPDTDCWMWTAYRNAAGYGTFRAEGKMHKAHRYAYEQVIGPIPDGLQLDHLCRNPSCVNPAHLEPVTGLVNKQRGTNKNKTHCSQGHRFDEANTYITPSGNRNCRTCNRLSARRSRLARHPA